MDLHTLRLFAVFLLSVAGCCSGQDAPPPGPLISAVGESVTVTPNISSTETKFLVITWNFIYGSETKDIIISGPKGSTSGPGYAGRVSVNRTTGSLELRELTLRDTGVYEVTLISSTGTRLTGESTLNVYEPVSNVRVRANATDFLEFNDTASLTCSADGTSLFYRWHNGSADITASERIHLSDDNRTLTISSVLRSDRGPLYCTVYNIISNGTSQPIFLNISFGPDNVSMTVDPQKEFHSSGSNLTLFCSAQSSPPAEFKWAFNGMMLNREGQKLKLEDIQRNQSGNYTCWGHNTRTLRYKPSDPSLITVMEEISDANITGPIEVLIAGNSSANLSCQAKAGTIISREWLKDGQTLSASSRITFSGDKRSVLIDPVEGTDNGDYQCILTNPLSRGIANYNLTVNYGPEDVVINGDIEVEVGHTVVLICSASSVPPPAFTWTFSGTEINMRTSKCTVENATYGDTGNYICVAENALTGLNKSSAVHVLTVTGPYHGPPLGAIFGGVIGALACVGLVAAVVILVMKNKKSSSGTCSSDRSTSNQQPNAGELSNEPLTCREERLPIEELAYADISHFKKADGGKVQFGGPATVYAQVTLKPGQAATEHQETLYAEVRRK